ncbi:hypothetical protein GCK72_011571 [Caenorhabditis remanei]|uniref:Uncharacterized protein n=1 Tax=Caenorhabditis remanei TaxID=31234 RepID=A0A6A5H856_CAERE|nr:hypothetical protein GCK72_011571 [Caenorhabditis remanei]KAF1763305.1 hypothetical protein GCK72_011571 [Caenorhabditis remanei]
MDQVAEEVSTDQHRIKKALERGATVSRILQEHETPFDGKEMALMMEEIRTKSGFEKEKGDGRRIIEEIGKRINGSTVPSQDGVFAVTFSGITQLSATTYFFLGPNATFVSFGGKNTGHGRFKVLRLKLEVNVLSKANSLAGQSHKRGINGSTVPSQDDVFAVTFSGISGLSATTYYFLGANAAVVRCGGKNAGQGRLVIGWYVTNGFIGNGQQPVHQQDIRMLCASHQDVIISEGFHHCGVVTSQELDIKKKPGKR